MTLTEFLLARIADRESVARDMQHQERFGRPLIEFHGGGTGIRELVDPARVLAECEAKRSVVQEFTPFATATPQQVYTSRLLFSLLALPHDDHPDYRAEWKP